LLHGADLLLADDRHGGEDQGDGHDDVGDHAGHEVVAAVEVGIEPDAGARHDLRGRRGDRAGGASRQDAGILAVRRDGAGEPGNERPGVARDEGRGVGVRAVDQDLNFGGTAAQDVALEAGEDAHDGLGFAAVEGALHVLLAGGLDDDVEPAGALEAGAQLARKRGAVHIHPGDAGVVDVEIDGEAEDQQLDEGREEEEDAHARLAQGLDEFLTQDDSNALPHRLCHLLTHFARRQPKDDCGVEQQEAQLAPQHVEADAFQEHPLHDGDDVARGDDMGDAADYGGHRFDRINETRKHERGKEGAEHAQLIRLQLIAGGGRDEDPPEQRSEQKGADRDYQGQDAAPQRHLENEQRDDEGDGGVGEPDYEVRHHLAENDLDRAERRREKLLHRAHLPLAGDGERGQEGGDDLENDGDQAGDDVVLRFERAVVPDAETGVDGGDQALAAAAIQRLGAQISRVAAHDGVG